MAAPHEKAQRNTSHNNAVRWIFECTVLKAVEKLDK
jgi:hypothetical protein